MVHKQTAIESARVPDRTTHQSQKILEDNLLYEPTEKESRHHARVVDSEAARRCGLEQGVVYTIVITSLELRLANKDGGLLNNLTWPYKYIRRYGRSKSSFTFEAGRKCPCGEGLFTFKVESGDQVFDEVQERTRAMKTRAPETTINGSKLHKASLPDALSSGPDSPKSPETLPPLPVRRYGSEPFANQQALTTAENLNSAPKLSTTPPAQKSPPTPTKHKKGLFGKIHSPFHTGKHKGSNEDIPKRISNGSDEIDGHSDLGSAGSARRPPLSISPLMQKRSLPDIPKDELPAQPIQAISLPSDHIYEDPQLNKPRIPSKPIEPHYHEYDTSGSSRYMADQYGGGLDDDRCHSSPADMQRPVPIPLYASDKGDDQYSSIPADDYSNPATDDYANPKETLAPKVSSLIAQLKDNVPPNEDSDVYSMVGNTYGCLDLINTQARPQSDIASNAKRGEQIYGRLSTGQIHQTSGEHGSYYVNAGKAKK